MNRIRNRNDCGCFQVQFCKFPFNASALNQNVYRILAHWNIFFTHPLTFVHRSFMRKKHSKGSGGSSSLSAPKKPSSSSSGLQTLFDCHDVIFQAVMSYFSLLQERLHLFRLYRRRLRSAIYYFQEDRAGNIQKQLTAYQLKALLRPVQDHLDKKPNDVNALPKKEQDPAGNDQPQLKAFLRPVQHELLALRPSSASDSDSEGINLYRAFVRGPNLF